MVLTKRTAEFIPALSLLASSVQVIRNQAYYLGMVVYTTQIYKNLIGYSGNQVIKKWSDINRYKLIEIRSLYEKCTSDSA